MCSPYPSPLAAVVGWGEGDEKSPSSSALILAIARLDRINQNDHTTNMALNMLHEGGLRLMQKSHISPPCSIYSLLPLPSFPFPFPLQIDPLFRLPGATKKREKEVEESRSGLGLVEDREFAAPTDISSS